MEGDILNLIPNKEYDFDWSVLRSDLGDSSEKVNSLTLNGTTIDGCNPPGNDYDCDFYDCTDSLIRKVKADKNSKKINVKANYQGHSSDCYCDQKVGKCISKKSKPTGYVSTFAAIKFNFYLCDNKEKFTSLESSNGNIETSNGLVNNWGDADCNSWVDGNPSLCDGPNYKENCAKKCTIMAIKSKKKEFNDLVNKWGDADCNSWVDSNPSLCDGPNYKENCAKKCIVNNWGDADCNYGLIVIRHCAMVLTIKKIVLKSAL